MITQEQLAIALAEFAARLQKIGGTVTVEPHVTAGGERGQYVRAVVHHTDGMERNWYYRLKIPGGWKWYTGDPRRAADRRTCF